MKIITISREFGSGGRELGKRLAEELGIHCYDHEIIELIAKEHGFHERYVANISEKCIEAAYPTPALVPAQAFAAAKVRELITFMELHLELVARNLYPQAFFGGTVSEAAREKVGIQLEKNIAAFAKLASFAPYVAGDSFSMADCAAIVHLPLVSSATKAIYGRDYLAELPVRDYLVRMAERPHVQRINADRKTSTAEMLARRK